jgi:hypothetical protein
VSFKPTPKNLRRLPGRASDGRWRDLFAALVAQGWMVQTTNGGHIKAVPPTGGPVFMPASPSSHRAYDAALAQLKRAGFNAEVLT